MRFVKDRPYADPDKAARRILEIAKGVEPINGRIHIEKINLPMLRDNATAAEYWSGLQHAIEHGWLEYHESGTFVTLTTTGTDLLS